jgi:hypothetical protein
MGTFSYLFDSNLMTLIGNERQTPAAQWRADGDVTPTNGRALARQDARNCDGRGAVVRAVAGAFMRATPPMRPV